jgi:hypothetical protein
MHMRMRMKNFDAYIIFLDIVLLYIIILIIIFLDIVYYIKIIYIYVEFRIVTSRNVELKLGECTLTSSFPICN